MSSHNEGPSISCSVGTASAVPTEPVAVSPTEPCAQAKSRSMFTCHVCSAIVKFRSNFIRHLERQHKMCHECNKVFPHSYNLRIHKESCAPPKVHYVTREDTAQKTQKKLPTQRRRHKRSHDKVSAFPCDICLRTFKTAVVQAAHRRRHFWHGLPRCRVCSATFASEQHLSRHIRNHERETSEAVRY